METKTYKPLASGEQPTTIQGLMERLSRSGCGVLPREREWPGFVFELHPSHRDFSFYAPPLDHHIISCSLKGAGKLHQERDGRMHDSLMQAGDVMVLPAFAESRWGGDSTLTLSMHLPLALLSEAAQAVGVAGQERGELLHVFRTHDPFVRRIADVLRFELDSPAHPAQSLVISSAFMSLAAHTLRRYDSSGMYEDNEPTRALGPAALKSVLSYIEDNLEGAIFLDELATLANVSRFNFARMFKAGMGVTPMAYVESCRMRRAKELIRKGSLALVEVALLVGYSDQSHFTRRFNRSFGYTPGAFAHAHAPRVLPLTLQKDRSRIT